MSQIEKEEEELDQIQEQNQSRKEIDEIYEEIGYGKYQIKELILFSIHFIIGAIFLMTPGYFFNPPKFLCDGKQCKNEQEYCDFQGPKSISDKSVQSITLQFGYYCKDQYMNSIGSALPYMGAMLGLLFFMWVSDNYGRRTCIGLSWLTATVGGILIVSFDNIIMIFIGFFISGFGVAPANFVELVMLNETSTGHNRSMSVCFLYVAFGMGELVIWPLSLITTDYRYFNLYFLLIPYIVTNCVYFMIYESPKFLQQKDLEITAQVLQKIANENNKNDYTVTSQDIEIIDKGNQKNYTYLDCFKYKSVRATSIGMVSLSMGIHALYYGIQFSLDLIGSDFAENSFYVGLADFAGYLISDFVCPRFPRKKWLNITLFIASAFCFSFAIDPVPPNCVPDGETCIQKTMQIIQAVSARFVISFSFSFMIIWMQELYPTSIRSLGVGLASALGLFGAEMTPFIKDLCEYIGVNFVIILGVFGVLGCVASLFMNETFQMPLLEEIPELTRRFSVRKSRGLSNADNDFRKASHKQHYNNNQEIEVKQRLIDP